jgi:DNA-binding transcriptional regulator YiaG
MAEAARRAEKRAADEIAEAPPSVEELAKAELGPRRCFPGNGCIALREQLGWSRGKLAKRAGVTQATIHKIESSGDAVVGFHANASATAASV